MLIVRIRRIVIEHAAAATIPVKIVSRHMFGPDQSSRHHLTAGAFVTLIGASLTRLTDLSSHNLVHAFGGGIGEFLGALGMSPVLEHVARLGQENKQ